MLNMTCLKGRCREHVENLSSCLPGLQGAVTWDSLWDSLWAVSLPQEGDVSPATEAIDHRLRVLGLSAIAEPYASCDSIPDVAAYAFAVLQRVCGMTFLGAPWMFLGVALQHNMFIRGFECIKLRGER